MSQSKNALISVFNKKGIVEFVQKLVEFGYSIYASGGTAKCLIAANIPVTDVASLAGGAAILGHRVVTLSRKVHAGLLARDYVDTDIEEMEALGLPFIDLVCVDLYPLKDEIDKPEHTDESVLESTDIGGPAMLRSAAKGRRLVICDDIERWLFVDWYEKGRPNEAEYRRCLAAQAEFTVSEYCLQSARYTSHDEYDGFMGTRMSVCKYGENPQQESFGLFRTKEADNDPLAIPNFQLIAGDALSHINTTDVDRLLQTLTHAAAGFSRNRNGHVPYLAFGVKHGNCCGGAYGENQEEVLKKMLAGDPTALFGGLIMVNFAITEELAEIILTHGLPDGQRRLLDGIIAPAFEDKTIELLKRKKDKCRFLANSALFNLTEDSLDKSVRVRPVRGGYLKQSNYCFVLDLKDERLEKFGADLHPRQEDDLLLAWAIGCTSNSNTITLTKDGQLIGNGVGQQARHYAADLAKERVRTGGHSADGAIAYSDSFFPFPDGVEKLIEAGVAAILASSGSNHDKEVKAACEDKITFWLIPDKVGRGFYNH